MKYFLYSSAMAILVLTACTSKTNATPLTETPTTFTDTNTAIPLAQPSEAFQTRVDDKGVIQVWVPAGSFMMGAIESEQVDTSGFGIADKNSELPQHEIQIAQGFWMDAYEVTISEFKKYVDAGGYQEKAYWSEAGWEWLSAQSIDSLVNACSQYADPNLPRVCVTWYEAEAYAHWRGGRLPTEAEWEYAAGGPDSLLYPWGNEFDETRANTLHSTGLKPVGSYPNGISWVGAYDMSGNAMEWVQDWFDAGYYKTSPNTDPTGPETGTGKVEKGGWKGVPAYFARAAYRRADPPTYQDTDIGFRIVNPSE